MNRYLKLITLVICLIGLTVACTVKPPTLAAGDLPPIDASLSDVQYIEHECLTVGDSIFMGTSDYDMGAAFYMKNAKMVAVHGTPILPIEGTWNKSIRVQLVSAIQNLGWPKCVIIQAGGWDLSYRILMEAAADKDVVLTPALGLYQNEIEYIDTQLKVHGVQDVFWTNIVPLMENGLFWSQHETRVDLNSWMNDRFGDHSINCSSAFTGNELDRFIGLQRMLIDGLHPNNLSAYDMAECVATAVLPFGYNLDVRLN